MAFGRGLCPGKPASRLGFAGFIGVDVLGLLRRVESTQADLAASRCSVLLLLFFVFIFARWTCPLDAEEETECGALAFRRCHADFATVELDQLPANVKSKTGAAVDFVRLWGRLPEAFEQFLLVFFADADAGIVDGHHDEERIASAPLGALGGVKARDIALCVEEDDLWRVRIRSVDGRRDFDDDLARAFLARGELDGV